MPRDKSANIGRRYPRPIPGPAPGAAGAVLFQIMAIDNRVTQPRRIQHPINRHQHMIARDHVSQAAGNT